MACVRTFVHLSVQAFFSFPMMSRNYAGYKQVDNYIVAGNCECDNELSVSIKCVEFLD